MDTPTIKELVLCLPKDQQRVLLGMVHSAQESLCGDESAEIRNQYYAIKDEIAEHFDD